jgi:hypothetical protein
MCRGHPPSKCSIQTHLSERHCPLSAIEIPKPRLPHPSRKHNGRASMCESLVHLVMTCTDNGPILESLLHPREGELGEIRGSAYPSTAVTLRCQNNRKIYWHLRQRCPLLGGGRHWALHCQRSYGPGPRVQWCCVRSRR